MRGDRIADSIVDLARSVAQAVGRTPEARAALTQGWARGAVGQPAADELAEALRARAGTATGVAGVPIASDDDSRAVVAAWCTAVAGDRTVVLAPLLSALSHAEHTRAEIEHAARARLMQGPLLDALSCARLGGNGEWLDRAEHAPVRARLELVIWEAGQLAQSAPDVGRWLCADPTAFKILVSSAAGARSLLARAVAACVLAIGADGMRAPDLAPSMRVAIERAVRRLATHPDSAVWIPACRAMGRLAAPLPEVRALLREWHASDNPGERRRAVTAAASMPAGDAARLGLGLDALPVGDDPWVVAAIGPAIPYLAGENRDAWELVLERLKVAPPGPEALFGVAQGLAVLRRRGAADRGAIAVLEQARARALAAVATSATEAQLWLAIGAHTDFLDEIEPDPSDPQRILEGLASVGARVGAARVAERARYVARSLRSIFETALPVAAGERDFGRRAAACSTIESCARAAAFELWVPLLAAAGDDARGLGAEVAEVRAAMVRALTPRLAAATPEHAFHRSALRVLASVADGGHDLGEVLAALETAPWIAEGGRTVKRFRKPIADLLWRAVDATRAPAPSADPGLYGRFAAWWSLSSTVGGALLEHLGRVEVAARGDDGGAMAAMQRVRALLDVRVLGAVEGAWAVRVMRELDALGAGETALAEALTELASALDVSVEVRGFPTANGLEQALSMMGAATARLRALLADPRAALGPAADAPEVALDRREIAELVRATCTRTSFEAEDYASRWSTGLGPLLSPLVARAVRLLLEAHAGIEATGDTRSAEAIAGYRLIKKLGEGQMGAVWLVRAPTTERHFVMKLPMRSFELDGGDRAYLDEAVALEADILKSIHHPNLANLIDYGLDGGDPFMVLEYLGGVDLEAYLAAGLMSLAELKIVVADVCAGLLALHGRGLVHRDLKPGNVFLRLDLGDAGAVFEPRRHRDPRDTPMLAAVIIDFGLASTRFTRDDAGEKTALGTLGFMPPEQARGVTAVDGRSDVYALAALVFAALTGSGFFEARGLDTREWLRAHALEEPLAEDPQVRRLPGPLIGLLREASALDPRKRPDVAAFAARFAAL